MWTSISALLAIGLSAQVAKPPAPSTYLTVEGKPPLHIERLGSASSPWPPLDKLAAASGAVDLQIDMTANFLPWVAEFDERPVFKGLITQFDAQAKGWVGLELDQAQIYEVCFSAMSRIRGGSRALTLRILPRSRRLVKSAPAPAVRTVIPLLLQGYNLQLGRDKADWADSLLPFTLRNFGSQFTGTMEAQTSLLQAPRTGNMGPSQLSLYFARPGGATQTLLLQLGACSVISSPNSHRAAFRTGIIRFEAH